MNNKWDEKEIEKTLSKLPPVKDHQSKDDLFQAIENKSKKELPSRYSPRKKRPWIFPSLAAAAAVFLLLLIVPPLFDNGDQQFSSDEAAEQNMMNTALYNDNEENEQNEEEGIPEENPPDEESASNNSFDESEEETGEEAEEHNSSFEENNESDTSLDAEQPASIYVATIYTVENEDSVSEYVVLEESVLNSEVGIEESVKHSLQESDFTSGQYMDNLTDISAENDTVVLNFADESSLESLTSSESQFLNDLFQELLALYGFNQVSFEAEGEPGIIYGQHGEVETIPVSSHNRGYYLIDGEEDFYLISGIAAGEQIEDNESGNPLTFEQTVEKMKTTSEDADWYDSAIPQEVEITSVRIPGDTARVSYILEDEEVSDEKLDAFFEALKLSAAPFTLDTLEIINEETDEKVEFELD
ncbi:hypothetical protein K8O68_17180 [Salipaludibacillus sp. CUR1]|uniref:hypothetical protein n=1 Tax=Salipaludibacillus sp. CUR1 TaxID=2820003 RepID=UPI001E3AEF17|nr:hypothetical protein [Salipaludibacillus sp. CUR1]MCE7794125.1 hypothetical protein [Salipaludibacillus sp. CUR1]